MPNRTIPVLCAHYCFGGGENAAIESPMLVMVDTESGMASAHVCRRRGSCKCKVICKLVFESNQELPARAFWRELAPRRPEMKLTTRPKHHSEANGLMEKCSAAHPQRMPDGRYRVSERAERWTSAKRSVCDELNELCSIGWICEGTCEVEKTLYDAPVVTASVFEKGQS